MSLKEISRSHFSTPVSSSQQKTPTPGKARRASVATSSMSAERRLSMAGAGSVATAATSKPRRMSTSAAVTPSTPPVTAYSSRIVDK